MFYLAKFVEKKTGRPFEELARSYLLDKLGMKDTAYTGRPWFDGRIAIPADETGSPLKPAIAQHYNDADLVYTTPTDYASFLGAVWRGDGLNPTMVSER